MAVVSVNELGTGRGGSEGEDNARSYVRVFQVLTDDPLTGIIEVRNAAGIPAMFDSYLTGTENDPQAIVRSKDAQQQDGENGKKWHVSVEYSTKAAEDDDSGIDNPLLRPSDVSWSFARFQVPAEKGKRNDPLSPNPTAIVAVTNSAGDAFDPPAEIDESRPVLVVTRNEPTFFPSLAITYQDAINSDFFLGFAPKEAKIAHISARMAFFTDALGDLIQYWVVTYEIHFNRDKWDKLLLDRGLHYNLLADDIEAGKPEEKSKIRFVDKQGEKIEELQLLGGNGKPLGFAADKETRFGKFSDAILANPFFLSYEVYKVLPFAPLNLP